jgi:hypothetical protein
MKDKRLSLSVSDFETNNNLKKSFEVDLEKGRAVPIGTINKYGEIKTAQGWKYIKKGDRKKSDNFEIPKEMYDRIVAATEEEAEDMVVKDWDEFTPTVINTGFCDIFAENLKKELGPEAKYNDTPYSDGSGTFGHTWIEYKGRYYDAEIPKGVDTIKEIPFVKRVMAHYKKDYLPEDFVTKG